MELSIYKDLTEQIEIYGENKTKFDELKKICDGENAKIKDMMKEAELKNYESENYKTSYIVSERNSFDEAKLIGVIHSNNLPDSLGIVKMKEYIDEDALESAIYNGLVSESVLKEISDCMTKKEVISLRISKKKGE